MIDLPGLKHPRFLAALRGLARDIRAGGFDLLHTFMADGALYGPLIGRWARVPVITSRRDLGYWQTPRKLDLLRLVNRGADGIIANAQAVADRTVAKEWVAPGKVHVIGNGHDPERFEEAPHPTLRAELGIPDEARLIGLVANFRPLKRQTDLVAALARLGRRQTDAHAIFLGEGDASEVLALAAELGVASRVHVLRPGKAVIPIVRHLTVGVLCSESEGLSNAIIEYMACGLPVIATEVGGNPELVDASTGVLYKVGDIEGLANALRRVLGRAGVAAKLAVAARDRYEARYTTAHMIERTVACYDGVLRRRAGPQASDLAVTLVEDLASLKALAPEWDALLGPRQFFLSPSWVLTWFESSAEVPCVAVVRDAAGALVGLLPLAREGKIVRFAGQDLGADHLDVVAGPGAHAAVAACALDALVARGIRRAVLDHVSEDGGLRAVLHGSDTSWKFSEALATVAHEVSSDGTFDTYLEARYSKNARQRFRRHLRQFEARPEAQFELITTSAEAETLLTRILAVHDERDGASTFATEAQRRFHELLIPRIAAEGRLFSAALMVEGRDLAVDYGFRLGGRLYGYQSGKVADPKTRSPGTLILYLVLREQLFGGDADTYDFLDGDEEYKSRWNTATHRLYDVGLDLSGRRGGVRHTLGALRNLLKAELKRRLGRSDPGS